MWGALSIAVLGAGALLSFVLSRAYISFARRRDVLDIPNQRSSHSVPVPRGGGLAFALPAALTIFVMLAASQSTQHPWLTLAGAIPLIVVGWLDDVRGVSNRWRLVVQILSAGWAVALVHGVAELSAHGPAMWTRVAIEIVYIVWMINLFNFMDGIDGIAAGQAAIGLLFAAAFLFGASESLGILLVWLSGLVVGFLLHNWAPARVFMGDVGSTFLGFVLGALAVWTGAALEPPSTVWILSTAPFIVDATLTLFRRILSGDRWWSPHRKHLYQRLVDTGRSHAGVTSAYMVGAVISGALASILVQRWFSFWLAGGLVILALAVAHFIILASIDHLPPPQDSIE